MKIAVYHLSTVMFLKVPSTDNQVLEGSGLPSTGRPTDSPVPEGNNQSSTDNQVIEDMLISSFIKKAGSNRCR